MNHIYKTIWNKSKNTFDVVAENVSSKGKGTSGSKAGSAMISSKISGFFAVLTPIAAMLFVQTTFANVEVASGNTRVFNANNGVQVVDIATANAAGVSHNRYVNYNVDKTGQILNNAVQKPNALSVMTQLAGNIQSNKNLDKSARVILNEVTGANRSQLSGHIEVSGNKADVVIANPYGITCSGCGFINTDRATLTTGTPQFDKDGSMSGFKVTQGSIIVDKNGLNASGQKLLQLLSRNLTINAQVNADQLEVVTGANSYSVATGKATTIDSVGSTAINAIDSSQLGGIYANRISLISSDQGVGVKILGNVAANAQDFTLTAAGKIELNNKISAKEKLSIQNTNSVAQQLNINGSLTAKNLEIGSNTNNKIDLNVANGTVYADKDLNITTNKIITNNAVLQAGAKNNLKSASQTVLNASELLSGQSLDIQSQSLNTSGVTKLSSAQDSVSISTSANTEFGNGIQVTAQKNINLAAQGDVIIGTGQLKSISSDMLINAQNIAINAQSSAVNTRLTAKETANLQQNSILSSTNNSVLDARNIVVDGKNYSKNSDLNAAEKLLIGATGVVSSSGQLNLKATDLTVEGQALASGINATVNNKLTTEQNSVIYADTLADLNAKNIDLKGQHFAKNLNAKAAEKFSLVNSGGITTDSKININAQNIDVFGDIAATDATVSANQRLIVGTSGAIQAAGNVELNAENALVAGNLQASNATIKVSDSFTADQGSQTAVANKIAVDSKRSDVNGEVTAKDIQINASENLNLLTNSHLNAQESLKLDAKNISLAGDISAKNTSISAQAKLDLAQSALIEAANKATLSADAAIVKGKVNTKDLNIQTSNGLDITKTAQLKGVEVTRLSAKDLLIDGNVQTKNAILSATGNLTLQQNALIEASNKAAFDSKTSLIKGKVNAKETLIKAQDHLELASTSTILSQDKIQLDANSITAAGKLTTTNAQINAATDLSISNTAELNVIEQNSISANNVVLSGDITARNNSITATNQFTSDNQLNLLSQELTKVKAKNALISGNFISTNAELSADEHLTLVKGSELLAVNRVDLKATDIDVENTLQAKDIYAIATGNVNLSGDSLLIADSNLNLNASGDIELAGKVSATKAVLTAGNTTSTTKNSLSSVSDNLLVSAKNISVDGHVYVENANLSAQNNIQAQTGAVLSVNSALALSALGLTNNALIYVAKNLTSNVSTLFNNHQLQSKSMTFNGLSSLVNSGVLFSNTDLSIAANNIDNTGSVITQADLSLQVSGTGDRITNSGTIAAGQSLNIAAQQANINNTGSIQSISDNLSLTADTLSNGDKGQIQAAKQVEVNGVNVSNAGLIAGNTIKINAKGKPSSTIVNDGDIAATVSISLDADDAIKNNSNIFTDSSGALSLTAKKIKNQNNTNTSGLLNTHQLNVKADTLVNDGSIQTDFLTVNPNDTTKTEIVNNAVTGASDNLGIFVFEAINALNLSKLTNNGTLYVGLNPKNLLQKSNLGIDELITGATGFTYINNFDNLAINKNSITNKSQLYLSEGSKQANIANFDVNEGTFTLNNANVGIASNLINTTSGKLNITNGSTLVLTNKNLDNKGAIYIAGSNTKASKITNVNVLTNDIGADILADNEVKIDATRLENNELIYGLDDADLYVDAKTLNNNQDGGILSLGKLNLNTQNSILSGANTVNNKGDIYAKQALKIGVTDSNGRNIGTTNINNIATLNKDITMSSTGNFTKNGSNLSNTPVATGGSIIADNGMVINANTFKNNFAITANTGDITINANTFNNETTYFGKSLRVSSRPWTTPSHQNDFTIRLGGTSGSSDYYDLQGNKLNSSSGAYITTTQLLAENGHDGIAMANIEEIWLRSTQTQSGISNSNANKYLGAANFKGAQLIANNGNINITINNSSDNYGGKIFALGGNVNIASPYNAGFTNQMIDLYNDRRYRVNYVLLVNRDGTGSSDIISYGYGFMKDNHLDNQDKGLVVTGLNEGWSGVTQYFDHAKENKSTAWLNNFSNTYPAYSSDMSDTQSIKDFADRARSSILNYATTSPVLDSPTSLTNSAKKALAGAAVVSASGKVNIQLKGTLDNLGKNAVDNALYENGTNETNAKVSANCIASTTCTTTVSDDINLGGLTKDSASVSNDLLDIDENAQVVDTTVNTEAALDNQVTDNIVIDQVDNVSLDVPNIEPVVAPQPKPKPTYKVYPTSLIPKLDISVPDSKYGQFVAVKAPESEYLIESNPLYGAQSDVLGSSYLVDQLGLNPDSLLKRLGDDGYEMNLVQKQIMQITGSGVLYASVSASEQMQQLFDNSTQESKSLGLTYGKALTTKQLSQLKTDIVWMVETEVNGQKVLAPQVYLSRETIEGINVSGAVIEGKVGTTLQVGKLNNVNATIDGGLVYVDAVTDINNIGGRIKGNDIVLKTQEGSINNISQVYNFNNKANDSTAVGPIAGIESSGTLMLNAAKDINNLGADLKSKGDALIQAGNDINIKSLELTTGSTTQMKKGEVINESTKSIGNGVKQTSTVTHLGSNVDLGGNAAFESGGNTLISGSDVNVKGQMYAKTGGDFTLESVQDSKEVSTTSSRSGFGVGGGIWGTETQQTNDFEGKNKASNLNAGSLIVDSADKVVIAGSNINLKDKNSFSSLSGKNGVDILDGKDEKRNDKTTTTTTFLKVTKGPSKTNSYTKTNAAAESKSKAEDKSASASASAGASAEAGVSASGSASLRLAEHTVTKESKESERSVATNINSKGSLLITSDDGAVTVRGSNVDVVGALGVKAKDINILAGQNKDASSKDVKQTSIGVYTEGSASASANASANAEAASSAAASASLASANASANAGANAKAEASGMATFGGLHETSYESSKSITHNMSSLKSGGDMSLAAQDTVTFQGANVNAGKNLDIRGTDIVNKAVADVHETKQSSSSHLAGYYMGASVAVETQAQAKADANLGKTGGGASAGVSATVSGSAELSQGLRTVNKESSQVDTATIYTGNQFTAGGNMTRVATNSITDEATQVEVAGNFAQKAVTIIDNAVSDTFTSTKSSQSHEATIGTSIGGTGTAGAGFEGKFGKESSTTASKTAPKAPELSIGASARYDGSITNSSETSTIAKTSNFTAGENIYSESSGDTSLTGTQFNAGKNIQLVADKLDYKAASDTTTGSSSGQKFGVGAGAEVSITGQLKSIEAGANYGNTQSSSQSSTAVVGGMNAGGSLQVITNKGASFEGTQLNAGADTVITGEKVDFKAAQSFTKSSSTSHDANLGIKLESSNGQTIDSGSGSLGYAAEKRNEASTTSTVSNINSGGAVTIVAKQASFEGTNLVSGANTNIIANTVDFTAARDTQSSNNIGGGINITAEGGAGSDTKSSSGGGSLKANLSKGQSASNTAQVGSISSGGAINIATQDASFEGTTFASVNDTNISGKNISFTAAKSTHSDSNVGVGVDVAVKVPSKDVAPAASTPVITPPTPQAAPAGSTPIVKPSIATTSSAPTAAPVVTSATDDQSKAPSNSVNVGANVSVGNNSSTTYEGSTFISGGKLNINADNISMQNTDTTAVQGGANYSTGPTIETLESTSSGVNFSGGVSGIGTNTVKQLSSAKEKVTSVLGLSKKDNAVSSNGGTGNSTVVTASNSNTGTSGYTTHGTNGKISPVKTVTNTEGDTTTTTKTVNTFDALKNLFSSAPIQPTVITPPTPQVAPPGAVPIVKPTSLAAPKLSPKVP